MSRMADFNVAKDFQPPATDLLCCEQSRESFLAFVDSLIRARKYFPASLDKRLRVLRHVIHPSAVSPWSGLHDSRRMERKSSLASSEWKYFWDFCLGFAIKFKVRQHSAHTESCIDISSCRASRWRINLRPWRGGNVGVQGCDVRFLMLQALQSFVNVCDGLEWDCRAGGQSFVRGNSAQKRQLGFHRPSARRLWCTQNASKNRNIIGVAWTALHPTSGHAKMSSAHHFPRAFHSL